MKITFNKDEKLICLPLINWEKKLIDGEKLRYKAVIKEVQKKFNIEVKLFWLRRIRWPS